MFLKIFAKQFLMILKINTKNVFNLFKFYKSYFKYRKISNIKFKDIYTCLGDNTKTTPFEPHYFYQSAWAIKNIIKSKPKKHTDIGSDIKFVGNLSQIIPVDFIDIRPFKTDLKNLKIIKRDIPKMPYKDSSLESISCLHVAEHIGLGRYGDDLNPRGTIEACKELSRILKKGGKLYFSMPIGKERECFNAHRIFNTKTILSYFNNLKLVEFSAINDKGRLIINADLNNFDKSNFSCGLFVFTK